MGIHNIILRLQLLQSLEADIYFSQSAQRTNTPYKEMNAKTSLAD